MKPLAITDPSAWPKLMEVRAERMRRSFALFVKLAWTEGQADPAPLIWNWHLDALCTCLQAVTEKRIQNLLINIPPGYAKSMIVSVLWPAWRWTRNPEWSSMFGSYELGLVMRDAVKSRTLIESDWYGAHFRGSRIAKGPNGEPVQKDPWALQDDQNTKKLYKTTEGGMRQATSVGLGTGYRGDTLVVDDPLSVDGAYSDVELKGAASWFFETMPTRFNDMATAERVVIMQRLHEGDVSGEILKREPGKWQHLCLPAEYDPTRHSVVRDNTGAVVFEDPRKVKGELLFPAKFPAHVLASLRSSLGPYSSSGQLDQRPSPIGGGMLKAHWFAKRWLLPGEVAPPGLDPYTGCPLVGVALPLPDKANGGQLFTRIFSITDAAFKAGEKNDRVAIGTFGFRWPNLYLLDLIWDQLDFTMSLAALRLLRARWPRMSEILIEDKANGDAIINVLKGEFPGVEAISPEGGKVSRILAMVPSLSAGNVIFPLSASFTPSPRTGITASIADLIGEAGAFPKGANDDGIDMLSYAVNRYLTSEEGAALAALAAGTPDVRQIQEGQQVADALATLAGALRGPAF